MWFFVQAGNAGGWSEAKQLCVHFTLKCLRARPAVGPGSGGLQSHTGKDILTSICYSCLQTLAHEDVQPTWQMKGT